MSPIKTDCLKETVEGRKAREVVRVYLDGKDLEREKCFRIPTMMRT
jgi:hypothetical protein